MVKQTQTIRRQKLLGLINRSTRLYIFATNFVFIKVISSICAGIVLYHGHFALIISKFEELSVSEVILDNFI